MKKRDWIILTIFACLGLGLRIVFYLSMKADWPGWESPTIDALYHHLWALKIAKGDILGGGAYFRAPFYPMLLGLIYAIFGPKISIAIIIQHLLGVTAIPLTYVLARKHFSFFAAVAASFLITIDGLLIYFESQLLLDFLTVLFMLLLIYWLLAAYDSNRKSTYFAAGFITGLFAITRPNILAVLPLIIIWILLARVRFSDRLKNSLLLLLGAAILILPVTVRNAVIGGDPVLIASQGGVNFYIGNNAQADGYTALLPGFGHTWQYSDAEYEAGKALGKKTGEIKPSAVSDYYYDKALKFIFKNPGAFAKLIIKKLYLFWNSFQISNNNNLYFLTDYIGMKALPLFLFAIIGPLGFIGTILCFFKDRKYWLFPFLIFGYMATVVAFFITARFRLPLVPLLAIMSAVSIEELYQSIRVAKFKKAVVLVAAFLAMGIFSWSNFYGQRDQSMAMAYYSLGNMLLKKGDYDAAKIEYQTALKQGGCVPNTNLNLGVISFYEKNYEQADSYFRDELVSCGPNAKAYANLSLLARLAGNSQQALSWADSSVIYFPNSKGGYINQILAAYAADDSTDIKQSISRYLSVFPNNPSAEYYYGLYLYQRDDLDSAGYYFALAASSGEQDIVSEYDLADIYSSSLPYGYNPQKIRGKSYYQLGLIAARSNNITTALDNFQKAVALMPDDPDALVNLGLAYDQTGRFNEAISEFRSAIAIDSTNALYYYNYAMTLGKTGQYNQAEEMLKKAIELKPDFAQARQVLMMLQKQLH